MGARASVVCVVVLGLALVGCGADETAPTVPDAGPLVDRCLSSSDMEYILASRVDAGAGGDAGVLDPVIEAYDCTLTETCAQLYFAEELQAAYECVNTCLDAKPSGALSITCRDCFTLEAVGCAGDYCLLDCVGGSAEACTACFQVSCQAALDACIGF